MLLLRKVYNQYWVAPFLANSLPKSGTHLLAKVLALFPGIRPTHEQIGHINFEKFSTFRQDGDPAVDLIPVGVSWPREVPAAAVERAIGTIQRGQFSTIHVPHSEPFARLLTRMGMKTLLILRDPRDVVVSLAEYLPRTVDSPFYQMFLKLTPPERIMAGIRGCGPAGPGEPSLRGIADGCRSLLAWRNERFNYTTYFHKLVGPRGGGAAEDQRRELKHMARHLGIFYRQADLDRIAEASYGGTATFRQGTSGDWRKRFLPEHRAAFKEVAGSLLIELGYERDLDW